jgi:hypothetical protein
MIHIQFLKCVCQIVMSDLGRNAYDPVKKRKSHFISLFYVIIKLQFTYNFLICVKDGGHMCVFNADYLSTIAMRHDMIEINRM